MATVAKPVYPHIEKDPEVRSGKACIAGTRIAVVDIVRLHSQDYRPEEMVDYYMRPLTLAQIHAALTYYYDHTDEIEAYFKGEEDAAAEYEVMRADYRRRHPPK